MPDALSGKQRHNRLERGVHLGFEVVSGKPVSIPVLHTVITGQTQRAGKTTALEALISRSNKKAVAFVTKRGEGSFADARTIPPYFREQADWKFVASILEASRGEKLKFERAWIIRASKGARTLADVQRNVRKALDDPKTRGMNADMYLTLDAYLEDVVPLIAKVEWAKRVTLAPGLNVVDMTSLNVEMQHLVIRSTIEWVLDHEEDTIVVVPEAWKFIPQGRGTPVKLAAESFIRQAAGLRNYLWLDSQDIAGVEKLILKSVPVWVLGVQRESNEIKRTLAQIPAGIKKPRPDQIATLGLGQFFVCHDTSITKVYVQPVWMSANDAIEVAQGDEIATAFADAQRVIRQPKPEPVQLEDDTVNEREAQQLRDSNERRARENADLLRRLSALESPSKKTFDPTAEIGSVAPKRTMDREVPLAESLDNEALYQAIKARLVEDVPALLRVLTVKPQLDIEVKREIITADGASLRGRIARLFAVGFFDEGVSVSDVSKELARRGYDDNGNSAKELAQLATLGFLTVEQGKDDRSRPRKEYRAVADMKVNIIDR